MRTKLRFAGMIAAVALIFVPLETRAQVISATISGAVKDTSGAVIPGAQVTVTNEGTGAARAVSSNASGYYTVPDLPVGIYSVSASAPSFKTNVHTSIDLHVGDQKVVDLTLQLGKAVETVEVTGGATLVQTRSGSAESLVGPNQMSQLPLNGRNFVQLTLLVPGASPRDAFDPPLAAARPSPTPGWWMSRQRRRGGGELTADFSLLRCYSGIPSETQLDGSRESLHMAARSSAW